MNRTMPRARSAKGAVALASLLCLLATTACGTRLNDTEIAADQAVTVTNATTGQAPAGQGDGLVPDGAVVPGAVTTDSPAAVAGAQPGAGALPGGGAATTKGGGSTSTGGSSTSGSKAAAGDGGGTKAAAVCTEQLAPIVIGQTGVFSGLVGQSTGNIRLGMSVWANWVNANGGIQCHPLKLYQMDDGSDPSRTAANVNELVTNKKAIALVGLNVPITMGAARSAAARLGVPIIGGDGGDPAWNTDPNLFMSGGSFDVASAGGFVEAVRETGFKKLGLIYCIEASPCQATHQHFAQTVAAAGGQDVFQQSVSLTQSDYTAECQNLKNSGAQIVGVYVDAASQSRFARSCKSIGYSPVLETGGLSVSQTVLNDPNIQAMTLYVGSINAPYVATGTPGLDTLHAAFKTFTGAAIPDAPSLIGWSAGMLFKGAIDSLDAATAKGVISTAKVLDGLYGLKDKTLGGLAPTLKFTRGQPSGVFPCYTVFKLTTKGVSASGPKFTCINWKL